MAAMRERHPENAPGDWYIDTACMDCSAARTVAPGLIVARGGQSVFARQPSTPAELMMAQRARLLCPTASVRSGSEAPPPADAFPEAMTAGVYRLGYNAKGSYGAHSFLIRRDAGNVMVDSPRWTRAVVARLEAWGGLGDILLSHEDDVGDDGRHLFTGDSLAWSFEQDDLTAFRSYCWSWTAQRRSLRRLLDYAFEWVFAGHGGSRHLPPAEMRRRLAALIERMAAS